MISLILGAGFVVAFILWFIEPLPAHPRNEDIPYKIDVEKYLSSKARLVYYKMNPKCDYCGREQTKPEDNCRGCGARIT